MERNIGGKYVVRKAEENPWEKFGDSYYANLGKLKEVERKFYLIFSSSLMWEGEAGREGWRKEER